MVVVGKSKFLKKDKTGYCYVLVCLVEFSSNQIAGGCLGLNTKNVFISEPFFKEVNESHFNRDCNFTYGTNGFGSPEPNGFIFLSEKS